MNLNKIIAGVAMAVGLAATQVALAGSFVWPNQPSQHVPATLEGVRSVLTSTFRGPHVASRVVAFSDAVAATIVYTDIRCPSPVPDPDFEGGALAFMLRDAGGVEPGCYKAGMLMAQVAWANGAIGDYSLQSATMTKLGLQYKTLRNITYGQ